MNPFKNYDLTSIEKDVGVSKKYLAYLLRNDKLKGFKYGRVWFVRGWEVMKLVRKIRWYERVRGELGK